MVFLEYPLNKFDMKRRFGLFVSTNAASIRQILMKNGKFLFTRPFMHGLG